MTPSATLVAGERMEPLIDALRLIRASMRRRGDGGEEFDVTLPPPLALPLARALLRIESELMLQEADGLERLQEARTYEQRAVDALVLLAARIGRARDASEAGEASIV